MRRRLCRVSDLDGDRLQTEDPVTGDPILVLRDRSGVHVVDALCPHQYAPLLGGELRDGVLTCPLHGWQFDVATGKGVGMPVQLRRCDALVDDGWIWQVSDIDI